MNHWLVIALIAYLIGGLIEGIDAASQLFRLTPDLDPRRDDQSEELATLPKGFWRVFAAIATVSLCGACIWPCRLIHRFMKESRHLDVE